MKLGTHYNVGVQDIRFIYIVVDEVAVAKNEEFNLNVDITFTFIYWENYPYWFILNSPVTESQLINVDNPGN